MLLNEITARAILDAAHRSWSVGDLDGVLKKYTDDLIYISNMSEIPGRSFVCRGKAEMQIFLRSILAVAESMSVIETFQYHAGIGRARIACFVRHKATGHTLAGTFRQVVMYRKGRICRLEEFHDAARMKAFWRLVQAEAPQMVPPSDDR